VRKTAAESQPLLSRLDPAAEPLPVSALVDQYAREANERDRPLHRPYVSLNMVCSLDGHAAIADRSAGLSSPADRALFHGLRSITDAVLVGAGTARSEGYGRIIRDADVRAARERGGRRAEPLACIVSVRLMLDPLLPLLAEPEAHVVVLTSSDDSLPPTAATVDYVRAANADGGLDAVAALRELRARYDVGELLCEGGPTLNAHLLADGLIDELHIAVSPVLAGGADPLTIVAPDAALAPTALTLAGVWSADSFLFLRYRIDHGQPLT
jgi:riboflavin-specific deaminase-like protein